MHYLKKKSIGCFDFLKTFKSPTLGFYFGTLRCHALAYFAICPGKRVFFFSSFLNARTVDKKIDCGSNLNIDLNPCDTEWIF